MVVCLVLKHCRWTPHCTALQALHRSAFCLMDTQRHGKSSCATSLTAHEMSCCSPRPAVLGSHCKIFVCIFPLMEHLLPSKMGATRIWSVLFLLHTQHFVEYPTTRSLLHEYFHVAISFFPLNFYLVFIWAMLFSVHKLQADCHTCKTSQDDLHQPNFGGKLQISLHLPKKQGKTT